MSVHDADVADALASKLPSANVVVFSVIRGPPRGTPRLAPYPCPGLGLLCDIDLTPPLGRGAEADDG